MNSLPSHAYQLACAVVPVVLAHGPTPEQRTAAELVYHTQSRWDRPPRQLPLFHQQHANPGVATRGQPNPVGCVSALSRNPE
jgi:hypothetical protein